MANPYSPDFSPTEKRVNKDNRPSNRDLIIGSHYPKAQVIRVPSKEAQSLDCAIEKLQRVSDRSSSFVVILENKDDPYILSKSLSSNISLLSIQAESYTPHMGVGYIQGAGQDSFQTYFDCQYISSIGGLGPWSIEIHHNKLTVCGTCKPDFGLLNCQDSILFYSRNLKCFTKIPIKFTCENSIYLDICDLSELTMRNGSDKYNLDDGDGFFICPRVSILVDDHQKITVSGRIEWQGLYINSKEDVIKSCGDREGHFVSGATNGSQAVENCVFSLGFFPVGHNDWYQPNAWLEGQTIFRGGANGTAIYQSHVGETAMLSVQSANLNWQAATFVNNHLGLRCFNNASVDTSFSNWICCENGSIVSSGSSHIINSNIFSDCEKAIVSNQQGRILAQPESGFPEEIFYPTFHSNRIGISLDLNSITGLAKVNMIVNEIDLVLDDIEVEAAGDIPAGTIGGKNSIFDYVAILSDKIL